MTDVSILGSTGSIGSQTLEVISMFPNQFNVVGLAAGTNLPLLREQISRFNPKIVSVMNPAAAELLANSAEFPNTKIVSGEEGAVEVAASGEADIVVSAMVGAAGLVPTLEAIKRGKHIGLANKEVLVTAGEIVTAEAKKHGATLLPIDSEHSALFQIFGCNPPSESAKRIILTASGGPLRSTPVAELSEVTVEKALEHPTWKMGSKITIDSATLMNKGFEMIEARWLFDFPLERISIWIHPQSVVHSMVEYIDGSLMAQLSLPDMKVPIAYALGYPKRLDLGRRDTGPIDFSKLTFEEPDYDKFPALGFAYRAAAEGGTMPAVLNAANEVAVSAFLNKRIGFIEISELIRRVMDAHDAKQAREIDDIFKVDSWARSKANSIIEREML